MKQKAVIKNLELRLARVEHALFDLINRIGEEGIKDLKTYASTLKDEVSKDHEERMSAFKEETRYD